MKRILIVAALAVPAVVGLFGSTTRAGEEQYVDFDDDRVGGYKTQRSLLARKNSVQACA